MKKGGLRFLVGGAMVLFGLYQVITGNYWESSLYLTAGLAFISIGLLMSDAFPRYRKLLNIVSWVLIILAVLLFFFLLRTDQYV